MPFTEDDLKDAVDLAGLAGLLSVSHATAERIAASGEIDVIRIGPGKGRPRFPRRSVNDYINRRATKAADNARKK